MTVLRGSSMKTSFRYLLRFSELTSPPVPADHSIKPNVFWHDVEPLNGLQFTADATAFGLERVSLDNPEFIHTSAFDLIDSSEVVDLLLEGYTTFGVDKRKDMYDRAQRRRFTRDQGGPRRT